MPTPRKPLCPEDFSPLSSLPKNAMSPNTPSLSIVILSWNTLELTCKCIESLYADTTGRSREIIVVDNGSADGSADAIAERFPDVILIRNADNRLYSEGNNQGAWRATGEYLCLLNSDTEVSVGALDKVQDFLIANPDYGAASPKLIWPDGKVQCASNRLPTILAAVTEVTVLGDVPPGNWLSDWTHMKDFDHQTSRDVDQPPGACVMMKRTEFVAMGGLDQTLSLYFNDVDLCDRLKRAGRKVRYIADAVVVHHAGQSALKLNREKLGILWWRNQHSYYRKRWGRVGGAWHRLVLFAWATEQASRYRLGPKTPEQRRVAMDELKTHVRACLAQ